MIRAPVLALRRTKWQYKLKNDARETQIRSVLLQELKAGTNSPFRYWSETPQGTGQELATMRSECVAVVWAVAL